MGHWTRGNNTNAHHCAGVSGLWPVDIAGTGVPGGTTLKSFRFPVALHLPSCKWWQQADEPPRIAGCWPCYASRLRKAEMVDGGREPALPPLQEVHGVRVGPTPASDGPARCCSCRGGCWQGTEGSGMGRAAPGSGNDSAGTGCAHSSLQGSRSRHLYGPSVQSAALLVHPCGVRPGGRFC